MSDHEYRPFGDDFPFSPATPADRLRDEMEYREMARQLRLPDPPVWDDRDDPSVVDGAA